MAADGSILFGTLLDDKEAQKELVGLNDRMKTLSNQIYTSRQLKMPLVEQSRQAAAQLNAAKAALLTLTQPLFNMIIPVFPLL